MTGTSNAATRPPGTVSPADEALRARLTELLADRAEVAAEAALPPIGGDMADRTQNVDALIRLATLDQHIEDLQVQLQQPRARAASTSGGAGVGSTVWLRFDRDSNASDSNASESSDRDSNASDSDDGEPYVIGYAEQARAQENIITVASPLGQAVLGAHSDSEISYAGPRNRRVTATVTRVAP